MSTKTFDTALDLLPKSRTSGGGKPKSFFAMLVDALTEGHAAEVAYYREIARGVHPAQAAAKAFSCIGKR